MSKVGRKCIYTTKELKDILLEYRKNTNAYISKTKLALETGVPRHYWYRDPAINILINRLNEEHYFDESLGDTIAEIPNMLKMLNNDNGKSKNISIDLQKIGIILNDVYAALVKEKKENAKLAEEKADMAENLNKEKKELDRLKKAEEEYKSIFSLLLMEKINIQQANEKLMHYPASQINSIDKYDEFDLVLQKLKE